MRGPTVQGELVLDGAAGQIHRKLKHHVAVVVGHDRTSATPTVEGTVKVDRSVGTRIFTHVHTEQHGTAWRRRCVVAGAIASAVVIVRHGTGVHGAVCVTAVVCHRRASRTVYHVVDQVFLVGKSVDGVLVFHETFQVGDFHRVHAVPIGISHRVVRVVCTPTTPWAGHKDVFEALRGTGHVHVERGLGLRAQREKDSSSKGEQLFHGSYDYFFNSNSVSWSCTRKPKVPGSTTCLSLSPTKPRLDIGTLN